jgi:proteasome lid subunit RPN8/RPN11
MNKKFIMSKQCFGSILSYAVQCYDKETLGLICGHRERMEIRGKTTDRIIADSAHPFLTATRKKDRAGFSILSSKNFSKVILPMVVLDSVDMPLIGTFHSHPDSNSKLSDGDVAAPCIETISKRGMKIINDSGRIGFLKIVIGLREVKGKPAVLAYGTHSKQITGFTSDGELGYEFDISGYVFYHSKKGEHEVEEVKLAVK